MQLRPPGSTLFPSATLFVSVGGTVTVNDTPLLARPLTVTTTLPVVAPAGTGAAMLVADQLVGGAAGPLEETVLGPWLPPKQVGRSACGGRGGAPVGGGFLKKKRG